MAQYNVGPQGATVFNADGKVVSTLAEGDVVVPGTLETAGSLADQYADLVRNRRRKGYDDKVIRPKRTSPTPPRQPDARLRNPQAGTG